MVDYLFYSPVYSLLSLLLLERFRQCPRKWNYIHGDHSVVENFRRSQRELTRDTICVFSN